MFRTILKILSILGAAVVILSCSVAGDTHPAVPTGSPGSNGAGVTAQTSANVEARIVLGSTTQPSHGTTPPEHDPVAEPVPIGPYRAVSNQGTPTVLPDSSVPAVASARSPEAGARWPDALTALHSSTTLLTKAPVASSGAATPDGLSVQVIRRTDLSAQQPSISGWEPSEADAHNVIVYSGNWFAAYSDDTGATFAPIDMGFLPQADGGWCCDQKVQYVPQIDRFVWIVQYSPGDNQENRYVLLAASPAQVVASHGTSWTEWDLTSKTFGLSGAWMDFPDLKFSTRSLYLSFDVEGGNGGAILARLPFGPIAQGKGFGFQYWHINAGPLWIAQNCQNTVYFSFELSTSQLRVYSLDEGSNKAFPHDVNVATIPTQSWSSIAPNGKDWLAPSTKMDTTRISAATLVGNQLWLGWSAGRDDTQGHHMFAQPHVELAIINVANWQLLGQSYIWDSQQAIVIPDLATNAAGEVGIIFEAGGGRHFVESYAGLSMSWPNVAFQPQPATLGHGMGGGGHYMSIRPSTEAPTLFSAAVHIGTIDDSPQGYHDSPYWVLFGPARSERATLTLLDVTGNTVLADGHIGLVRLTGDVHDWPVHITVPDSYAGDTLVSLQLTIVTGHDDLRGGNDNADAIVQFKSIGSVPFHNINQSQEWQEGHTATVALTPVPAFATVDLIQGLTIHTAFTGGCCGDNWDISRVMLTATVLR